MHGSKIIARIEAAWGQFSTVQQQILELVFGLNGRTALAIPDAAAYMRLSVDELLYQVGEAVTQLGVDVGQASLATT